MPSTAASARQPHAPMYLSSTQSIRLTGSIGISRSNRERSSTAIMLTGIAIE